LNETVDKQAVEIQELKAEIEKLKKLVEKLAKKFFN
jgi:archaellum component FlaC